MHEDGKTYQMKKMKWHASMILCMQTGSELVVNIQKHASIILCMCKCNYCVLLVMHAALSLLLAFDAKVFCMY